MENRVREKALIQDTESVYLFIFVRQFGQLMYIGFLHDKFVKWPNFRKILGYCV